MSDGYTEDRSWLKMIAQKDLQYSSLLPLAEHVFTVSAAKLVDIERTWDPAQGAPVFTANGRYTSRGWTDWTQGLRFGSLLLQYEATDEASMLELGRERIMHQMASHLTHTGVHDHGFNNVSTYGNLRRLALEGRYDANEWEVRYYELALAVSAAVQASRWAITSDGSGYIYSFNGPQSLFADTIRSLRVLALGYQLKQVLMGEGDVKISLLHRLVEHATNTARYNVYYGEGRDIYDVSGRVAHESIFNTNNGQYRCPSTQQGYSAFSTWTRGLAWIILGYAEQLEYLTHVPAEDFPSAQPKRAVLELCLKAAKACADFYIANTAVDGIPYWDAGAPGLVNLPDHLNKPADPFNPWEPVDSSAAAIAAQGLLRLGHYLNDSKQDGEIYTQAGLTVARTLFQEPYLSIDANHQGLLLHSVYHRPNGWDYQPDHSSIPHSESSMWGDYHLRELAVYVIRQAQGLSYPTFFSPM
jgi:unsaturated chondroitin disaccharide hydrolase